MAKDAGKSTMAGAGVNMDMPKIIKQWIMGTLAIFIGYALFVSASDLATAIVSVTAKPKIELSNYEEECYEYQEEKYIANITWWDYKDKECHSWDRSGYWNLNCSFVPKYIFYNSSRTTDKCSKYHLVRKV